MSKLLTSLNFSNATNSDSSKLPNTMRANTNLIFHLWFLQLESTLYPVHVGLNISGANRTHLALTFIKSVFLIINCQCQHTVKDQTVY
jgi:hypothetical protein